MHFPRVHWSEGMFLVPQHFQAADAHWDEAIRQRGQWDGPYYYGVHRIEISPTALESKRFQLNVCEARFKDGACISYGAGMGPGQPSTTVGAAAAALPAVGLEEAFARADVARVYLALPSQRSGQASENENGAVDRFRVASRPLMDEAGDTEEDVEFREFNARLMVVPHDPGLRGEPPQLQGYDLLQIAQVKRTGEKRPTPELSENFFPPVLAIDAWPPLGRELILGLFDRIGAKLEELSTNIAQRGIGADTQHAGDVQRMFRLSRLYEAHTSLNVLCHAQGVHPFVAYHELCRTLGQLSVFHPDLKAPEIPAYDHEDLAGIFQKIREQIEFLLDGMVDRYQCVFFIGEGRGMSARLRPEWLGAAWQWYVGVRHNELNDAECRALLRQLDWKLGSEGEVEVYFNNRVKGLGLVDILAAPAAIPAGQEWSFYQVQREGPAWEGVSRERTLALRVKDMLIANKKELTGGRDLLLALPPNARKVLIQFALFAVPVKP